jgi:hypothetical protein
VEGSLGANTDYTITSNQTIGHSAPPALQTIAGDYVDNQGNHVDFDGNFNLQWAPQGGERGFEIETSHDGQNWQVLADVDGNTTSYAVSGQSNGTYYYRVRAIDPGQIGMFVTVPSNVISVVVDQRSLVDITNQVKQTIANVSLTGGVFQLDLSLTNQSANTYVPLVNLNVVGINSTSGTVKVINADNGNDGASQASAALFGYSAQLGADQQFTPNEMTAARTMKFQDSAAEMFTFDAVVTAYVESAGSPGTGNGASSSPPSSSSTSGSGSPLSQLTQIAAVMRFTANPLTNTVTAQLISIKH